jgi:tetratricopeptide (TPR) repeat protein
MMTNNLKVNRLLRKAFLILLIASGCAPLPRQPGPMDSQRARGLIDQGVAFLRESNLSEAEASFEVSHDLFPSAQAIDGLGCVSFLKGDYLQAEQFFMKGIFLDPEYSEGYRNLATLYEISGLTDAAERLYRRAIAIEPRNYQARNNLGALLAQKGLRERGRKELARAKAVVSHPIIDQNIRRLGR